MSFSPILPLRSREFLSSQREYALDVTIFRIKGASPPPKSPIFGERYSSPDFRQRSPSSIAWKGAFSAIYEEERSEDIDSDSDSDSNFDSSSSDIGGGGFKKPLTFVDLDHCYRGLGIEPGEPWMSLREGGLTEKRIFYGRGSRGRVSPIIFKGQESAMKLFNGLPEINGVSGELMPLSFDPEAPSLQRTHLVLLQNINGELVVVDSTETAQQVLTTQEVHRLAGILMNFSGISFSDKLQFEDRSPLIKNIGRLKRVAKGLDYLKKNNIVHGSLNLSKITIDEDGENSDDEDGENSERVTLIGFGSSCQLENGKKISRESNFSLYSAPEIRRGEPFDTSADIWSLGLSTFELLWGRGRSSKLAFRLDKLFQSDKNSQRLPIEMSIEEAVAESFFEEDLDRTVSDPIRDLVHNCLSWNPEERLTPQGVLTQLEQIESAILKLKPNSTEIV